jgi:tRNA (guanine-N7-)-methyltransferase
MGADRSCEDLLFRGGVSQTRPRYQFYGRRKGHALRRHHLQLIETLLPKLRVDPQNPLPSMAKETWLEIGFGGGEHLAHQAKLNRDVWFIGAEPFINGVAKLLALIEEKRLTNINIFDGDARYLLEALPDASLSRIYLLYPDPWPKARHHKRRFVNEDNLKRIGRSLISGGQFLFASDMADYVEWTRIHLSCHEGFAEEGDPTQPFEGWIETRYEIKAKRAGRKLTYLRFRRA